MKKYKLRSKIRAGVACSIAVAAAVSALPALAAGQTQHLRGTIASVSDHSFTMTTNAGQTRQIMMSSKTRLAAVTNGDLSHIKKGTFIGTANVKRNGQNQALEMVIFPPSMKGAGLGNYSWDLTPSMEQKETGQSGQNASLSGQSGSSMSAGSKMTNGTVSSKSSGSMASGSSMTNGTVKGLSKGGQSVTLKVNYGKGSKKIVVPANVPTVKIQAGKKSDLKKGAHVFVAGPKNSGAFNAQMVIVGKNGVVPPM